MPILPSEADSASATGGVDYGKIKMGYNDRMDQKKKDLIARFISEDFTPDPNDMYLMAQEDPSFRGSIADPASLGGAEEQKAGTVSQAPSDEAYEQAYAAYQAEMVRYEEAKVKYEKFKEQYKHVDFSLLNFLPEIQEEEYYR